MVKKNQENGAAITKDVGGLMTLAQDNKPEHGQVTTYTHNKTRVVVLKCEGMAQFHVTYLPTCMQPKDVTALAIALLVEIDRVTAGGLSEVSKLIGQKVEDPIESVLDALLYIDDRCEWKPRD